MSDRVDGVIQYWGLCRGWSETPIGTVDIHFSDDWVSLLGGVGVPEEDPGSV
jgi:hypothetical protein